MARAVLHWLAAAHIAAVAFLQMTSNLSFGMILSGFCTVLVALAHFAEGNASAETPRNSVAWRAHQRYLSWRRFWRLHGGAS